jgi:hypothetical protein
MDNKKYFGDALTPEVLEPFFNASYLCDDSNHRWKVNSWH